jgi:hypothetical protein
MLRAKAVSSFNLNSRSLSWRKTPLAKLRPTGRAHRQPDVADLVAGLVVPAAVVALVGDPDVVARDRIRRNSVPMDVPPTNLSRR